MKDTGSQRFLPPKTFLNPLSLFWAITLFQSISISYLIYYMILLSVFPHIFLPLLQLFFTTDRVKLLKYKSNLKKYKSNYITVMLKILQD